jgi:hypothetical protein
MFSGRKWQNLECYVSLQPPVACQVDLSHTSASEKGKDFELRQMRSAGESLRSLPVGSDLNVKLLSSEPDASYFSMRI